MFLMLVVNVSHGMDMSTNTLSKVKMSIDQNHDGWQKAISMTQSGDNRHIWKFNLDYKKDNQYRA